MNDDMRNYKFYRTSREAMGSYYYPERKEKLPYLLLIFILLVVGLLWFL